MEEDITDKQILKECLEAIQLVECRLIDWDPIIVNPNGKKVEYAQKRVCLTKESIVDALIKKWG